MYLTSLGNAIPSTKQKESVQESNLDNLETDSKNIRKSKLFRGNQYAIFGVISSLLVAVIMIMLPKPSNSPGVLNFKTSLFSDSLGNLKENEKNPEIIIDRTGGYRGEVKALILIEEKDDLYNGKSLEDFQSSIGLLDEKDENKAKLKASLKYLEKTSILVTFSDGQRSKKVRIPILDDDIWEGNEQITLRLTNLEGEVEISTKDTARLAITDEEDSQESNGLPIWTIIFLMTILIAVDSKSTGKEISISDEENTDDQTNIQIAKLPPQVFQKILDEAQVVKAIRQPENQLGESFPIVSKDLPISYREMMQGWRYLRNLIREGVPTELDLEATIEQIGQQGFLFNPVLKPRRINKIELLLLIDQDGSMVPFHHLSKALIATASRD